MEPVNKLVYYEDRYGKRNEDEDFDRFPDVCEDETEGDSDEGRVKKSAAHPGFFKRNNGEFRSSRVVKPGFNRFREIKGQQEHKTINHLGQTSEPATVAENSQQYKIAPSISRKRSVQIGRTRKLTPKKHGFFAPSFARMEGMNTAGEAMDDILRAGGLSNYDEFPTLGDDGTDVDDMIPARQQSPTIDPALTLEGNKRALRQKAQPKMGNAVTRQQAADSQDGFDGDVEDSSAEAHGARIVTQKAGLRGGKPTPKGTTTKPTHRASKSDGEHIKVLRTLTSYRYPRRKGEKVEKAGVAKRSFTQTSASPGHVQRKANNGENLTARTTTLHKRAKKKGVATGVRKGYPKEDLEVKVGGKNVRLRNWQGDVIKGDSGFILIETDEEDAKEYIPV